MNFVGVNFIAVIVATLAAFGFGAFYYGALSKLWMKAAKIKPEGKPMQMSLFATSFVLLLVLATGFAVLIGHLGAGQASLSGGFISGLILWATIILTTMTINHRYEQFGWDLTLIDGGHWLGVSLILGSIIGWFGVASV